MSLDFDNRKISRDEIVFIISKCENNGKFNHKVKNALKDPRNNQFRTSLWLLVQEMFLTYATHPKIFSLLKQLIISGSLEIVNSIKQLCLQD